MDTTILWKVRVSGFITRIPTGADVFSFLNNIAVTPQFKSLSVFSAQNHHGLPVSRYFRAYSHPQITTGTPSLRGVDSLALQIYTSTFSFLTLGTKHLYFFIQEILSRLALTCAGSYAWRREATWVPEWAIFCLRQRI